VVLDDPLCLGRPQRYSIWVSNVGGVAVEDVRVVSWLPAQSSPVLDQSTAGAEYDGVQAVTWQVVDLAPGETRQFELQVSVPTWLRPGEWITHRVSVAARGHEEVATSKASLLARCDWLRETADALAMAVPSVVPTATPAPASAAARSPQATLVVGATRTPSVTPIPIALPGGTLEVERDQFTMGLMAVMGVLVLATVVLLYRRIARSR
jgi:hypothetical protein